MLLNQATPRPLTHEFISNRLTASGVNVESVCVTMLQGNTYYAVVKLRVGETLEPKGEEAAAGEASPAPEPLKDETLELLNYVFGSPLSSGEANTTN
jgi:hypothetical protein